MIFAADLSTPHRPPVALAHYAELIFERGNASLGIGERIEQAHDRLGCIVTAQAEDG